MEEKFKVKRAPKEAPIEFAQLRTYPEAAKMVEEVMSITNHTKAQTVYDMVKYAYDHMELSKRRRTCVQSNRHI